MLMEGLSPKLKKRLPMKKFTTKLDLEAIEVARASSLGKEMHQNDLLSKLNNELNQEDVYKLKELMAPPQWPLNAYDSKLEMSTAYYKDRLALSTDKLKTMDRTELLRLQLKQRKRATI